MYCFKFLDEIRRAEAFIYGGPEPKNTEELEDFNRNLETLRKKEIDKKDVWYIMKYDPIKRGVVIEFPNEQPNSADVTDKLD